MIQSHHEACERESIILNVRLLLYPVACRLKRLNDDHLIDVQTNVCHNYGTLEDIELSRTNMINIAH